MFALRPYRKNDYEVYNPFREIEELERTFFGEPFFANWNEDRALSFRTDISDNGDSYLLEAELPGFDKKDIKLDLSGNTLTITANHKSEKKEKEGENGKYLRVERFCGEYRRSFDISEINTDAISAKYENGVLSLTLPKKQPSLPESRQLEIQ